MTPAEKGAALAARRISRGAVLAPHLATAMTSERREAAKEARNRAQELRSALKAGVTCVSAPQLFPTPPALARRMVELATGCWNPAPARAACCRPCRPAAT